jgi:hypothetical protein
LQHRFRRYDTLDGENHKARFGLSVSSLGDINLDTPTEGGRGYHGKHYVLPLFLLLLPWTRPLREAEDITVSITSYSSFLSSFPGHAH